MHIAITTFGRFNPITIGHEKLINKMRQIAEAKKPLDSLSYVHTFVYLSKSHDVERNPLTVEEKTELLTNTFKNVWIREEMTPYLMLEYLCYAYDEIIFVVGEDRIEQFKSMKHYAKEWGCNNFSIVNAGRRNSKSRIAATSASRMRQAVINNDYNLYKSMVPKAFSEDKIQLMWQLLVNRLT
jgi:nicotinic acid mononucleotide adenylyltransferase